MDEILRYDCLNEISSAVIGISCKIKFGIFLEFSFLALSGVKELTMLGVLEFMQGGGCYWHKTSMFTSAHI